MWLCWAHQVTFTKVGKTAPVVSAHSITVDEESNRQQLRRANSVIYTKLHKGSETSTRTRLEKKNVSEIFLNKNTAGINKKQSYFPTPFKCSGVYCSQDMTESSPITLFSRQELDVLGKDNVNRVAQKHDTIKNQKVEIDKFYTTTHRTIVLAKEEARGATSTSSGKKKETSVLQDTVSKSIKTNWARQVGEVSGGAANYYKQVKICQNCHAVYAMLDFARELLLKERTKMREQEVKNTKELWEDQVAGEVKRQRKILRRDQSIVAEEASVQSSSSAAAEQLARDNASSTRRASFETNASALGTSPRQIPYLEPLNPNMKMVYSDQSAKKEAKEHMAGDRPRPWQEQEANRVTKAKNKKGKKLSEEGACTAEVRNPFSLQLKAFF